MFLLKSLFQCYMLMLSDNKLECLSNGKFLIAYEGEFVLLFCCKGCLLYFFTNITLGWKFLPVTKRSSLISQGITQYYKTFYGRNLLMFVVSYRVCSRQAFPVKSNVCWQGRNLTDWSTFQAIHSSYITLWEEHYLHLY